MLENTYKTHQKILGAIFIAYSVITLFGALSVLFAMNMVRIFIDEEEIVQLVSTFGNILGIFLLIVSLPSIIAGVGLLRGNPWAKTLSLIIGVILLLFFPIGTVIGIYAIWLSAQHTIKPKEPVYATDLLKNA